MFFRYTRNCAHKISRSKLASISQFLQNIFCLCQGCISGTLNYKRYTYNNLFKYIRMHYILGSTAYNVKLRNLPEVWLSITGVRNLFDSTYAFPYVSCCLRRIYFTSFDIFSRFSYCLYQRNIFIKMINHYFNLSSYPSFALFLPGHEQGSYGLQDSSVLDDPLA